MARRQRLNVKLRTHKGLLCKTIGCILGRDGTLKKKTWYFDAGDRTAAVNRVMELKARWKVLRAEGRVSWNEDPDYVTDHSCTPERASSGLPVTVGEAAKMYLASLEQRRQAGQVGRHHCTSQQYRLNAAIEPLAKLPLSVVGDTQLEAAVLRLAERPFVRRPNCTGSRMLRTSRMSPVYSRACIATLKWFCLWCDESDQVEWQKPRMFRSIFKVKPTLTTDERRRELEGDGQVDNFTVDELKSLWLHANDFQRTLMLLGLNCAFGNAECASLQASEMKGLNTTTPVVERYRVKTIKSAGRGSYGKWHLWPETADHMRRNHAQANEWGLALLNEMGKPLVNEFATYRQDEICHQWRRLVKRAGVRDLGFKYLRKTAAHLVRVTLGFGSETADMLLAHADGAMIRHYAGRDWDGRLRDATQKLRVHLDQMFTTDKATLALAS